MTCVETQRLPTPSLYLLIMSSSFSILWIAHLSLPNQQLSSQIIIYMFKSVEILVTIPMLQGRNLIGSTR